MAPDEKRKECGQELVNKYFDPKVAAAFVALCHMFPCRMEGTVAHQHHPGNTLTVGGVTG